MYRHTFMNDIENKYFGRKRGKSFLRLSRYQKLLSHPNDDFFKELINKDIKLEIGIGDGIKISEDAHSNPSSIYLGCDIFIDGVLRAARYQYDKNLKNLFVFHINIQTLIPHLVNNSLDSVGIYFPDPWPKNRHKKRRTLNAELVKLLIPKMKNGSKLSFASDHGDYFFDALHLMRKFGFKIEDNTPNMWQYSIFNAIGTKYEKKALDKNNKLFYFSVLKTY